MKHPLACLFALQPPLVLASDSLYGGAESSGDSDSSCSSCGGD